MGPCPPWKVVRKSSNSELVRVLAGSVVESEEVSEEALEKGIFTCVRRVQKKTKRDGEISKQVGKHCCSLA